MGPGSADIWGRKRESLGVCVCVCKYTQAGIGQSEPQSPAGSAPARRCYSGYQPQNPLGAAQQGDQAVRGLREFVSGVSVTP